MVTEGSPVIGNSVDDARILADSGLSILKLLRDGQPFAMGAGVAGQDLAGW